jgi:hypothetical protein
LRQLPQLFDLAIDEARRHGTGMLPKEAMALAPGFMQFIDIMGE